jgi:hypothetical protein
MSEPRPFGSWAPTLSGIIPSTPPPLLIEPPEIQYHFDYSMLRSYRMLTQPYIVRVNYDMVQEMIEDRIAAAEAMRYQAWLQWMERNL